MLNAFAPPAANVPPIKDQKVIETLGIPFDAKNKLELLLQVTAQQLLTSSIKCIYSLALTLPLQTK